MVADACDAEAALDTAADLQPDVIITRFPTDGGGGHGHGRGNGRGYRRSGVVHDRRRSATLRIQPVFSPNCAWHSWLAAR